VAICKRLGFTQTAGEPRNRVNSGGVSCQQDHVVRKPPATVMTEMRMPWACFNSSARHLTLMDCGRVSEAAGGAWR
jgi:hypothetical protein